LGLKIRTTAILRTAVLAAALVCGPPQQAAPVQDAPTPAQAAPRVAPQVAPRAAPQVAPQAAPVWEVRLLNLRPHDPGRYTQGLFIKNRVWFESSGGFGVSAFIREPAESGGGPAGKRRPLPPDCFAEGAAWAQGEIYLWTWRNRRGFVLDPETLAVKREFTYPGEGWGLAWDGRRLWRSDGSDRLYSHRAGDFAPAGPPLSVHDGGKAVEQLNELEWDPATGLMLANVYGLDRVAAIDLGSGEVRFWLDAAPLRALAVRRGLPDPPSLETALNGLARDGQSLWLTGKLWPVMFQIAWPPRASSYLKGRPSRTF
jgi:glutamine cyclotransferase